VQNDYIQKHRVESTVSLAALTWSLDLFCEVAGTAHGPIVVSVLYTIQVAATSTVLAGYRVVGMIVIQ
jgi:hypothetical protein